MSALAAENCGCSTDFVGASMANSCGAGAFLTFMTILETYINGRCELRDPCNRIRPQRSPNFEYDFIIVGGGTGGPVVASRLSENPSWKVLLLEAGNDAPIASEVPSLLVTSFGNPLTDWNYKTEPQSSACLGNPEHRCSWPRGKLLGGCSAFNGMMYMRGTPRDYDNWASIDGLTDWSYPKVLPYFKKSEDNRQIDSLVDSKYHSTGGYLTVQQFNHVPSFADDILKAADELKYGNSNDLNGDKVTGFSRAQCCNRDGMRLSAARAFLRPATNRTNLHVMVNSTATRVVIDPDTKNVEGVEFEYSGRIYYVKATKEVVLSAGAINSPQLLLLSGVGPKKELEDLKITVIQDLPGVGKNLHNHVAFSVPLILENENATNEMNWVSIADYLLQRKGPMSSTGMSQITGKLNTKYADKDGQFPDSQFFFDGYLAFCSNSGALTESESHDIKRVIHVNPVTLHPKSRGYVALKSSDPFEAPLMQPNYLTDEYDIKVLIEATKMVVNFENSEILKKKYGIRVDKTPVGDCLEKGEWGSDEYWECAIRHDTGAENHQVGTCKMGADNDNMAVLDSYLKVKKINGLRVMDASAIPTIVSGNTAAPIMMIAERGADFIKSDWGFRQTSTPSQDASIGNRFAGDETTGNENSNSGYGFNEFFNRHKINWPQFHRRRPYDVPFMKPWFQDSFII